MKEQEVDYCSFIFKNSYILILKPKSYPFVDGASTAAKSRGKLWALCSCNTHGNHSSRWN